MPSPPHQTCVNWYNRNPRGGGSYSDLSTLVNETLGRLKLQTHVIQRQRQGSGGLAVLLRGGAFRGAPSDTLADRLEAQIECGRSIESNVLRPYHSAGVRAEVFVTVYDADYCSSSYDGTDLFRPYVKSLRTVTIISADVAEQLSAAAAALHAFALYCREHADSFDAVVMTRYDLRFKASIANLLGNDLSKLDGLRFLWHELGNNWRAVWAPTPKEVERADEKQRAAWAKMTQGLKNLRDKTFRADAWRRIHRVPDTLHAFSFEYLRCFTMAIHHEMALGWPPNQRAIEAAESEARKRGSHSSASKGIRERLSVLQKVKDAGRANPGVPPSKLNISLSPLFPWNHWMHRMLPQVAGAFGIDVGRDEEWRLNKTKLPYLNYLVPEGAWSSNPCAGAGYMLNSVYELMPRDKWVVDAGICQRADDFLLDDASGSTCCPAPDYCCPNSLSDCSRPEAVLFDASRVSDASLLNGWRRHYYSRLATRGPATICNASDWNGGGAHPPCFWAMDQTSVRRVRDVWTNAPTEQKILEDDDDTHTWSGSGAPVTVKLSQKEWGKRGDAWVVKGLDREADATRTRFCARR